MSGPTPPQRTPVEAAFAKLCSACQVPATLQHDRLEGDMVNRLIFFDTPQTTADQRRAPQSSADGAATCRRVGPRARRTPISLRRARTAITRTLVMPTAPTTKAMPPRAHPGGAPVALSARRTS